jgi:hypothetical protein
MSVIISRGATMTSVQTTFLSGIACLFSILALVATKPASVLCRTLYWELLEDIFLEKYKEKYTPKQCHNQLKSC